MANTILTPTALTRESLALLRNSLTFTKGCNRDWSKEFANEGNKIGDIVNVRVPAMYSGAEGATLVTQDHIEQKFPVKLTTQFHVGVNFSSVELTLSLQDFSKRVLASAISTIANKIDTEGLAMAEIRTSHFTGKPGVTLSNYTAVEQMPAWLRAKAFLQQEAVDPKGNLMACLDPFAQVGPLTAFSALFNASSKVSDQYSSGSMGNDVLGMNWSVDQNVITHTVGATTGTVTTPTFATDTRTTVTAWNVGVGVGTNPTANPWSTDSGKDGVLGTASASGGVSINIVPTFTGGGTVGFKAGDVMCIANVFAVNPQTRLTTNKLRRFVVLANTALAATTVAIATTVLPVPVQGTQSSPYQTVVVTSTSATAVVTLGSPSSDTNEAWTVGNLSAANMVYDKGAFTLATANLEMPSDVHFKAQETDPQLGISLRILRQYTIDSDKLPCRVDVLFGWGAPRPQHAAKVFI